jgi:hypothetical protein
VISDVSSFFHGRVPYFVPFFTEEFLILFLFSRVPSFVPFSQLQLVQKEELYFKPKIGVRFSAVAEAIHMRYLSQNSFSSNALRETRNRA